MSEYYAILTDLGSSKLAAVIASDGLLEITSMAIGDGSGLVPAPVSADVALVNEVYRAPLNALKKEPNNEQYVVVAEMVIPEEAGGFWMRELGLYDADGDLIAIANCPPTYKPEIIEGSARVQYVRMYIAVSSSDHITLLVDPAVVLATRTYVDDEVQAAKVAAGQHAESYTDNLLQLDGYRIVLVDGCLALQAII